MHILSPVTDNCSSWISGRGRTAIEIFFMIKSQRKNVPDIGIELGAAYMPSGHTSDQATVPGLNFMWKDLPAKFHEDIPSIDITLDIIRPHICGCFQKLQIKQTSRPIRQQLLTWVLACIYLKYIQWIQYIQYNKLSLWCLHVTTYNTVFIVKQRLHNILKYII